ncbi:MAG: OmpA family protein [Methylotenera sp.]|nr:OmpA family protein [Oligoflexia bacterium]
MKKKSRKLKSIQKSRALQSNVSSLKLRGILLTLTLGATLIGMAMAPANASSVNVQTHTATGNSSYMMNESAQSEGAGRYFFGLDYNYLNEPLVELNPSRERRLNTLVSGIQTLDLTAGVDLAGLLSLNATVPVSLVRSYQNGQNFALGDARLFSKIYLVRNSRGFNLSFIPEVRLPTGDKALFLSDDSAGYGGMVALDRDFGFLSAVANLGYRRSSGAQFRDMDYRNRLPMSLGVSVPLTQRWAINGEASGQRVLPMDSHQNPGEFYAGAKYRINQDAVVTGGGSVGSTNQVASADYRILFGLKFAPLPQRELANIIGSGVGRERMISSQSSSQSTETSQAAPIRQKAAKLAGNQILIDQEIRFAHDSDRLLPSAKPVLDRVAKEILAHQAELKAVEVQGHCNELGSDGYNLILSQKRATAVQAYLSQQGVQSALLTPIGYGKRVPKAKAPEYQREARLELNRRVEFKVEL